MFKPLSDRAPGLCARPVRHGARVSIIAAAVLALCGCAVPPGLIPVNVPSVPVLVAPPKPPTRMLRGDNESQNLFAKGNASGKELLKELLAIKGAAASGKFDQSMDGLMGSPGTSNANTGIPGLGDLLRKFTEAVQSVGGAAANDIAFSNADVFLGLVTSREDLLATQTVSLPQNARLTAPQRQQVLLMASMVVAIRISNKLVEESARDFKALEQNYMTLLDKREKAATLLQAALTEYQRADATRKEAMARELGGLIGREDLAFLQAFSQDKSLSDFKNDIAAQNIALRYLRTKDPAQFKEYQAQADTYVSAFGGYLRATTGTVAFLGFSTAFYKHASRLVSEKKAEGVAIIIPYAGDLFVEVSKLATNLAPTADSLGGVISAIFGSNGFNVDQRGKRVDRDVGVSRVFQRLTAEDKSTFKANLFKQDGYLSRLYTCDRPAVGNLLDRTVPAEVRQKFMTLYYGVGDSAGLTFSGGLDGKISPQLRKNLAAELLSTRAPRGAPGVAGATAAVQEAVEAQAEKLERQELMRMTFAVHDGAPTQARLSLQETGFSPVPSSESIYVYESFTQGCLSRWLGQPTPPAPPGPRNTSPPPRGTQPTPGPRQGAANPPGSRAAPPAGGAVQGQRN